MDRICCHSMTSGVHGDWTLAFGVAMGDVL